MEPQKEQQGTGRFVWVGLIGSAIVALCCFTPLFIALLGVLGLRAVTGYLDYVLLPALGVCVGITVYGLYRQRRPSMKSCCTESASELRRVKYDRDRSPIGLKKKL